MLSPKKQPSKIICIGCDDEVNDIFEWSEAENFWEEPPSLQAAEAQLSPAFEKIDELNEDIEACVYLTDLGSDDFGEEPIYPVLWVSIDKTSSGTMGRNNLYGANIMSININQVRALAIGCKAVQKQLPNESVFEYHISNAIYSLDKNVVQSGTNVAQVTMRNPITMTR